MNYNNRLLQEKNGMKIMEQTKERVSEVTAASECSRLSEKNESQLQFQNFLKFQNNISYKKFFQSKVKQTQITPAINKKAINWLITFCWTRNYTQQILWYSVGYFYAYISSKPLKKERLILILISAVNIALKLNDSNSSLSYSSMQNLVNNAWTVEQLREAQAQIFSLFEFDLYFPNLLSQILNSGRQYEEIAKILFLSQLLFFNNYQPAINDFLLEDILDIVAAPENQNDLKKDIMKLGLNSKVLQTLKQKFCSKFHVDNFLQSLSKRN